MPVKVARLWKDARFRELPNLTKLLYIYLCTSKDLNVVGVFSPVLESVCVELKIDIEELRYHTRELVAKKFIYVKKIEGVVYFVIPAHFNTIPKSEASILKIQKALASLPDSLSQFLKTIGITTNFKVKEFKKPTPEEAAEYAVSLGYLVSGKDFVEYYENQAFKYGRSDIWVDGRGTPVKDWKAKLRKVWCKQENKMKTFDDAPKGFEAFYININGVIVYPDGWKNGKPFSKDFTSDIELKKQFNENNTN